MNETRCERRAGAGSVSSGTLEELGTDAIAADAVVAGGPAAVGQLGDTSVRLTTPVEVLRGLRCTALRGVLSHDRRNASQRR